MNSIDTAEWLSFSGTECFERRAEGVARYKLALITEGCSVIVRKPGDDVMVATGEGLLVTSFVTSGSFELLFDARKPNFRTSVRLPWMREDVRAGWEETESFVQTELKSPDVVSPEIRAMMDNMQRNAMLREAALRDEIERIKQRK